MSNFKFITFTLLSIFLFCSAFTHKYETKSIESKESFLLNILSDINNTDNKARHARKCKIVKRSKFKKELYSIVLEIPNERHFDNSHAVIHFDKQKGIPTPKNQKIVLHSFTKPKKKEKFIELESEAFEFEDCTANKTLTFTMVLYNNKNKPVEKVKGKVSFGETPQKEEVVEAVLVRTE